MGDSASRGPHGEGPDTFLSLSRGLLIQEPRALLDSLPYSEVGGVARSTTSRETCVEEPGLERIMFNLQDWHGNDRTSSLPESTESRLLDKP